VRGAQDAKLVLHGVFEDAFLLEDESPLLVVVGCVGGPAVTVPPRGPVVLQGGAASGTAVSALFVTAGTVGAAVTAAEEGAVVAEVSEEEGCEGGEDDDEDDAF
jgi:hypothetical protein